MEGFFVRLKDVAKFSCSLSLSLSLSLLNGTTGMMEQLFLLDVPSGPFVQPSIIGSPVSGCCPRSLVGPVFVWPAKHIPGHVTALPFLAPPPPECTTIRRWPKTAVFRGANGGFSGDENSSLALYHPRIL